MFFEGYRSVMYEDNIEVPMHDFHQMMSTHKTQLPFTTQRTYPTEVWRIANALSELNLHIKAKLPGTNYVMGSIGMRSNSGDIRKSLVEIEVLAPCTFSPFDPDWLDPTMPDILNIPLDPKVSGISELLLKYPLVSAKERHEFARSHLISTGKT